jgi:hypothetical protein
MFLIGKVNKSIFQINWTTEMRESLLSFTILKSFVKTLSTEDETDDQKTLIGFTKRSFSHFVFPISSTETLINLF